jgi:hypothetical protein
MSDYTTEVIPEELDVSNTADFHEFIQKHSTPDTDTVVLNQEVKSKMNEQLGIIKKFLNTDEFKKIEALSKDIRNGKLPVGSCVVSGGSRKKKSKKYRQSRKKKGGGPKRRGAAGAAASDYEGSVDGSVDEENADRKDEPDITPEMTAAVSNNKNFDKYDFAALAYIVSILGGLEYFGIISTTFNSVADNIARKGGLPHPDEVCDVGNMVTQAEISRLMTGMRTCVEVQRAYLKITQQLVATLSLCIGATIAKDVYDQFDDLDWSNSGKALQSISKVTLRRISHELRERGETNQSTNPIGITCELIQYISGLWGAAGSVDAIPNPNADKADGSAGLNTPSKKERSFWTALWAAVTQLYQCDDTDSESEDMPSATPGDGNEPLRRTRSLGGGRRMKKKRQTKKRGKHKKGKRRNKTKRK